MYILGISYGIDSSAALTRDGAVVAAAQEERFNREKHTRRFPEHAIRFCLEQAGIGLDTVDRIAFFWNPGRHLEKPAPYPSHHWREHVEYLFNLPNSLVELLPGNGNGRRVSHITQTLHFAGHEVDLECFYCDHHLAHAASAFYPSPFDDAAILTVDGYGEHCSVMLAEGSGNQLHALREIDFPHSPGSLYAAVTQYLGFQPNCEEGTVMAMASCGDAHRFSPDFRELVTLHDDGTFAIDLSYFSYYLPGPQRCAKPFSKRFGPPRQTGAPLTQRHFDIAAALQQLTEGIMLHLATALQQQTGQQRLCLAGGVALNSVANAKLLARSPFTDIFIQPAAGDAGSALGAALYQYFHLMNKPRTIAAHRDYLGPEFSDAAIRDQLAAKGIHYTRHDNIARECARLVANGQIVGWFQGRMEFGPRALGNRSIIADPRNPEMPHLLNHKVKHREAFRPYAPAVMAEYFDTYFTGAPPNPFMLLVGQVRDEQRAALPAITHIDGSARIQSVSRESNPRFWELLDAFRQLTGVPVILNTSFNLHREPIVCTVSDALRTFNTSDLDCLALGNYLLVKE